MADMSVDKERARKNFAKFLRANSLSGRQVSEAAGMSPSAVSQFLRGNSQSPKVDTLRSYARGASALLHREVSISEMIGDSSLGESHRAQRASDPPHTMPVAWLIDENDELHPEKAAPIEQIPAPPGFGSGRGAAAKIAADLRPLFDRGDVLLFQGATTPSRDLPSRPVIVRTKAGKLLLKRIVAGTRRGRYHLMSLNPLIPPLADEAVEGYSAIEWTMPVRT